jgi:uncharacterized protein (TIGR03435 family)
MGYVPTLTISMMSAESKTGSTLPPDTLSFSNSLAALEGVHKRYRDQVGLKLESQKGPVEFLVVDHAENGALELRQLARASTPRAPTLATH